LRRVIWRCWRIVPSCLNAAFLRNSNCFELSAAYAGYFSASRSIPL
jgi:hypothetical protein